MYFGARSLGITIIVHADCGCLVNWAAFGTTELGGWYCVTRFVDFSISSAKNFYTHQDIRKT